MSKSVRRAAIAAEIARREREAGITPERHVYIFEPHLSDEGGPRPFVPARCLENLALAESDDALYDGDLMRRLLDSAIRGAEVIELVPDPSDCFMPDAPPADYSEFGLLDQRLMIFSARAAGALRHLLEPCCQRIPVRCAGHDLVGWQLRAVQDVLDAARSEGWWHDYKLRQRASDIWSYAFFTERLGQKAIFTVPQHWRTLVLQTFVDVVRQNKFNGFKFQKVWPHLPLRDWV